MGAKFDLIIIGAGPAGASAALTARHRNKTVAVIANPIETSALYKAKHIGNYPGIEGSGRELIEAMQAQVADSGAQIIHGRAISVMKIGKTFGVAVGGDFYEGTAVIIAAGITRETAYPGENEFLGRGVSYCATCDGMLYKGRTVAVIGGGAETQSDIALLESLGCTVIKIPPTARIEIVGRERVESVITPEGEYRTDAVFILKDTISVKKLIPGLEYDGGAVAVTAEMETNLPGIFAAGDCTGKPFQLARAVGQGNIAAISASAYIEEKTNI